MIFTLLGNGSLAFAPTTAAVSVNTERMAASIRFMISA
jgi:hypothetical protein